MVVEHIHLSQQAKDQLVRLKRATGLTTWNSLCRWALCASLAEAAAPPPKKIPADSNVEMSWRVFAGADSDVYVALLRERCARDGLPTDTDTVAEQFRLHLHRGIAYLSAKKRITGIHDLVAIALAGPDSSH
ncbi:MAG: DNA sulfur modification protein DndE [Bryobacterales bacterium]|nr:DNA sulfur modification protein DndE [Bryobacterales bacterium]